MAHPHPKLGRSRYWRKPVADGKGAARGKSRHSIPSLQKNSDETALHCQNCTGYWIELATLENALLAFDPIKRTVPTTKTRITASITAYSAISCPASSRQSLCISLYICSPPGRCQFPQEGRIVTRGCRHHARAQRPLSNGVFGVPRKVNDGECSPSAGFVRRWPWPGPPAAAAGPAQTAAHTAKRRWEECRDTGWRRC